MWLIRNNLNQRDFKKRISVSGLLMAFNGLLFLSEELGNCAIRGFTNELFKVRNTVIGACITIYKYHNRNNLKVYPELWLQGVL